MCSFIIMTVSLMSTRLELRPESVMLLDTTIQPRLSCSSSELQADEKVRDCRRGWPVPPAKW
jgi:hypothetical protein